MKNMQKIQDLEEAIINSKSQTLRYKEDAETQLADIKEKYKYIFTIEEGCIQGGFGSSVLEYFSKFKYDNIINLIGVDDEFIEHGSRKELLELTGLSVSRIYDKIIEVYEE